MANKATISNGTFSTITSLKDGAYKQAKATESLESLALHIYSTVPAFLTSMPEEVKAELESGYRLRYTELNKGKTYASVGGNYLLIDGSNPDLERQKEKIVITVDYATSFTPQQFGKLRGTDINLHALIKVVRDDTSDYISNRLGDLKRKVKALNPANKRERGITADFTVRVKNIFDELTTQCKTASGRGDETANEARFKKSKLAFMTVWNHAE